MLAGEIGYRVATTEGEHPNSRGALCEIDQQICYNKAR